MKSLIIPAAGKGKRMGELFFPKCLLPVKQKPILFEIIDFWNPIIDEVVLVINNETGPLIKEYIQKYYLGKTPINFCFQNDFSGTYFAIKEAMKVAKNDKFILNWSDILPTKSLSNSILMDLENKNIVFTTSKKSCRWEFNSGNFINRGPFLIREGGIFGIFIINNLAEEFYSFNLNNHVGEVEILEKLNPKDFINLKFEEFIDIGDEGKYNSEIRKSTFLSNAFGSSNSMEIFDNLVVKSTKDEKLKNGEENWYKNMQGDFIPKVYSYSPLILERLNGISVAERLNLEGRDFEEFVISKMFFLLKKIHTSRKEIKSDNGSTYDQYLGKTIRRLEKIDFLFSRFKNNGRINVNGFSLKDPLIILKEKEEEIKKIFPDKFYFIHGDLQLSNALINEMNDIYVIDPRGYFGNTSLFGDPMYDFAKLYYGFCGDWDSFSKGFSVIKMKENYFEIYPLLEEKTLERRRKLFFKISKEQIKYCDISEEKIDLLHSIIWLSACDFISNDVLSSFYGYLYGTFLLNKFFNEYEKI